MVHVRIRIQTHDPHPRRVRRNTESGIGDPDLAFDSRFRSSGDARLCFFGVDTGLPT